MRINLKIILYLIKICLNCFKKHLILLVNYYKHKYNFFLEFGNSKAAG